MATSGTGASPDTGADAAGGDKPDNTDAMVARFTDIVNKAITARDQRFEARITKLVDQRLEALAGAAATETTDASASDAGQAQGDAAKGGDAQQPKTLKALEARFEAQMKALQHKLEASEKQRQEAEDRVRMSRLSSEVKAKLAERLEPHMVEPLYVYLQGQKRFDLDDSGQVVANFKREYGPEQVPLDQAIDELVKTDLKPYVRAENAHLPPAAPRPRSAGAPFVPPRSSGQAPTNPLLATISRSQASKNPQVAAALDQAAYAPLPHVGGSSK